MWCPFCSHENTRVVDSRLTRDGMQIRRRRQCEECGARFNTYESPEIKAPRIIKADGGREAFSEAKLRDGMMRALEKRPVETREVERVTQFPGFDGFPMFSHDGRRLVFASNRFGKVRGETNVFIADFALAAD